MKEAAVIDHIISWLDEYIKNSGVKGLVVGISGGIDSAVTSTLCAMTGHPVLIVEMPIHQAKDQVRRGEAHIEWLKSTYPENVTSVIVELTHVFDDFLAALPENDNSEHKEMALVNSRARLRMTTLYYFAGLNNYIVAGTGNKVEDFGIGFFTKYGDGGVDISPIADLMKTEIYQLGKWMGIHNEILTAPPTDGLWGDDRTDEDQIGATYPELEWAMEFDGDENTLTDRQKEVLYIYKRFHTGNKHKMVPIPVCEIPPELKP